MYFSRAGAPQQPDDLARGRAAHDRVIHDDEALAANLLAQRRELDRHATLAQAVRRLDECPPGVPVAHHSFSIRDAAGLGIAGRGRRARVRHRHDQVGLRRRLVGQLLTHSTACLVKVAAEHV